MRNWLASLSASALLLLAASPSTASTLSLTGSTLSFTIGTLPTVTISQSPDPVPVLVSSGGGSFAEPAGLFATALVMPVDLFTGVSLISSLNVTLSNATGSFTAAGGTFGAFGGAGALAGLARVGVLAGALNISVPLSVVGAGGKVATGVAALNVTVTGHRWTLGPVALTHVTTVTESGALVNTVTLTGYDNRSADHAGTLQLVTPVRIFTNAIGGGFRGLAVQTLTFVPEPGTLLLVGPGIAGLVIVGRRKLRK
jgi:hypothetical protein